MASGGHVLLQQKPGIEARIKILVNNDLKEICKHYQKQVSGNKIQLQRRCQEVLDDVVNRGDVTAFNDFRFRVANHGRNPDTQNPDSSTNAYGAASGNYSTYPMAPGRAPNGIHGGAGLNPGGKHFKASPFYEILDTVLSLQLIPDGPEMPQNRHSVRSSVTLSADQARRMERSDMRLLLYCGDNSKMSLYHPVDVAFPNQIEVKINGDDVKHNFKGLKNKPGSTKPADVTGSLRKKAGYSNQITITYALTTKRYAYVIHMARYISPDALTERIRTASVIPKQKVLDEMNRANADPDIAATSVRMSLKDPISTIRITLPIRSTVCTHNQCFDGAMFLQLQEQAPQWSCPVCNKTVSFQSLCVDKYFEDILNNTSKSIQKVDIEPNGEWRVINEEEDEEPNGASTKPRASYDDDFDDDLVEVAEPGNKQLNGMKMASLAPDVFSPLTTQSFPMNTPPLSSREASVAQSTTSAQRLSNKRPASAIIDLTLSEDDEPPRAAVRQRTTHTSNPQPNTTPSYNTPASIPDQNRYPKVPQRNGFTVRPPSNEVPPPPSPQVQRIALPASPGHPQSPARATPTFGSGSQGWGAQHSRPSSNGYQIDHASPFGMRATSSDSRSPPPAQAVLQPPTYPAGGLRLPPMQPQQHQDGYQTGWRSDYGTYSNSPR